MAETKPNQRQNQSATNPVSNDDDPRRAPESGEPTESRGEDQKQARGERGGGDRDESGRTGRD